MEKANQIMDSMTKALKEGNDALKKLRELTKEEIIEIYAKKVETKNTASKKYYEKNKELINEKRKQKYAEKKKAESDSDKSVDTTVAVEVAPIVEEKKKRQPRKKVVECKIVSE